jgi:hypothetical protein
VRLGDSSPVPLKIRLAAFEVILVIAIQKTAPARTGTPTARWGRRARELRIIT